MRKRGVPINRAWLVRAPVLTGDLLVEEHYEHGLGRNARTAKLKDPCRPREGDLLPILFDVQLLWVAPQGLMLTGFERVDAGGSVIDYAQSWWCRTA